MTELVVKSARADAVRAEVEAAIESQRRLLRDGLRRTRRHLDRYEGKYGFSTQDLLAREQDPSFDDSNLELIEWIGETRTLHLVGHGEGHGALVSGDGQVVRARWYGCRPCRGRLRPA